MPAERFPGGASQSLDSLLKALAQLPDPSIEELRETVGAMGIDPGDTLVWVRELMVTKERDAHLLLGQSPRPAHNQPEVAIEVRPGRRWLDRRFVKIGSCVGTLGGICCLGKAVTVGAGLGASSFFGAMVDQYQLYFVLGSLGLLGIWLLGMIGSRGITATGLRAAMRSSARHALVSFGAYFVTLGFSIGIMALADWLWPRS